MEICQIVYGVGAMCSLLTASTMAADRFVSLSGGHVPPFTNWTDAATNIQDAVDAASTGETVWVTNGVFATGGKVMAGDLTNRVALDKALALRSVNGAAFTVIQGAWDPVSTNGPGAVRCLWITNGASVEGFTITGGATRISTSSHPLGSGGGVWGASSVSAVVSNCVVSSNAASFQGGGCFFVTVRQSKILGNKCMGAAPSTGSGGGTAHTPIFNTFVSGNEASGSGGGVYTAIPYVENCTIVGNRAGSNRGGGITGVRMTNCIVYFNSQTLPDRDVDLTSQAAAFCCMPTMLSGPGNVGNVTTNPQLVDGMHLAIPSPCRGAGTNISNGVDMDGEAWSNPPSIGCDEVVEAGLTGSLAVEASALLPFVAERGAMPLTGLVNGRASQLRWDFGDGLSLTNGSFVAYHSWTNAGDYSVSFTAFNLDNTNGVSTNLSVHVVPLESPVITAGGLSGKIFHLSFPGQPGVAYTVERTTNLMSPIVWQSFGSFSSTGATIQVSDITATNNMRFYRVKGP